MGLPASYTGTSPLADRLAGLAGGECSDPRAPCPGCPLWAHGPPLPRPQLLAHATGHLRGLCGCPGDHSNHSCKNKLSEKGYILSGNPLPLLHRQYRHCDYIYNSETKNNIKLWQSLHSYDSNIFYVQQNGFKKCSYMLPKLLLTETTVTANHLQLLKWCKNVSV